jgi:hypothetical protein
MRRDTLVRWLIEAGGNVSEAARRHQTSKQLVWYHVHQRGLTGLQQSLRGAQSPRPPREPGPKPPRKPRPPYRPDPDRRALILQAFRATRGVYWKAARVVGIHFTVLCYHVRRMGLRQEIQEIRRAAGRGLNPAWNERGVRPERFALPRFEGAA